MRESWKNGSKKGVQTHLCRDFARRFSGHEQKCVPKFKVKKNIVFQSIEEIESGPNSAQVSVGRSDSVTKKALNDSSFPIRKDISSHLDSHESIVGKKINAFASRAFSSGFES